MGKTIIANMIEHKCTFLFVQRILFVLGVSEIFFLFEWDRKYLLYDSTLQFFRYLIIFQNGISHVSKVHEFTALMILPFLDAHLLKNSKIQVKHILRDNVCQKRSDNTHVVIRSY